MTFHRTLPALMLGLLLAGCSTQNPVATNDTGGTTSAAQYASTAGVTSEAAAISEEFDVSAYEDGAAAKAELDASFALTPGLPTVDTAIDPAFWYRTIRDHERRYVVEFDYPDTNTVVAHVRIVDRLKGKFNIVTTRDSIGGGVIERRLIAKPLADTSVRKAVFRRHRIVRDGGDDAVADAEDNEDGYRDGWSRWKLVALSGHEVTSDDGTRSIQSVRLQAGDVDVTVTDPLELKRVRNELIHLPPATPVHVTVQTGDATDVVVLYTRWGRQRMRPAEGGGFEGRFPTPLDPGLRHLAVNAIAHGTIYDDIAPYDSKAWGIPFIVGPVEAPVATNE